jgi:hypothetical protein
MLITNECNTYFIFSKFKLICFRRLPFTVKSFNLSIEKYVKTENTDQVNIKEVISQDDGDDSEKELSDNEGEDDNENQESKH